MFVGMVMGTIIGYKIDGRNKRIMPWFFACFAFRCAGLFVMTVWIDDYATQKPALFGSFIAMQAGTFIQTVAIQSMINKRLIAPIKEIMNGVSQAMRAIGVLIVTGVGGLLSKNNVNAPFMLVGCFDFALCLTMIWLACTGRLKE